MRNIFKIFITVIIIQLLTRPLIAQNELTVKSNTEGLRMGLDLGIKSWSSDYFEYLDELEPNGIGAGLQLGYGINQQWEIIGEFEFHNFKLNDNSWNNFKLSSTWIGMRYNFRGTLQAFRPYVDLNYGFQNMKIDPVSNVDPYSGFTYSSDVLMNGGILGIGTGFNYFLNPKLALNLNLQGGFGKFSKLLIDGIDQNVSPDLTTLKISAGIVYRLKSD